MVDHAQIADAGLHRPKYHTGFLIGLNVTWQSVTQVQIATGACRNDADNENIVVTSTLTAAITASGANGLDTGSAQASTWYSVWVISDSTGTNPVASLLSTSQTSPTLPSGYDRKRRVGWVRNNASSNFREFTDGGWRGATKAIRHDPLENSVVAVLNSGGATSFTDVNLATLVPPGVTQVRLLLAHIGGSTNARLLIREDGRSETEPINGRHAGGTTAALASAISTSEQTVRCSASRVIEYANNTGGSSSFISVKGYRDAL